MVVEGMESIKLRDGWVGCCSAVGGGEAVSVSSVRVLLDRRNETASRVADGRTDGLTPDSGQHAGIMAVGSSQADADKSAEDRVSRRSPRFEVHLQWSRMHAVMACWRSIPGTRVFHDKILNGRCTSPRCATPPSRPAWIYLAAASRVTAVTTHALRATIDSLNTRARCRCRIFSQD